MAEQGLEDAQEHKTRLDAVRELLGMCKGCKGCKGDALRTKLGEGNNWGSYHLVVICLVFLFLCLCYTGDILYISEKRGKRRKRGCA